MRSHAIRVGRALRRCRLGMWAYSHAAFRIIVHRPAPLPARTADADRFTHRRETDVPVICPPLYFGARLWRYRRSAWRSRPATTCSCPASSQVSRRSSRPSGAPAALTASESGRFLLAGRRPSDLERERRPGRRGAARGPARGARMRCSRARGRASRPCGELGLSPRRSAPGTCSGASTPTCSGGRSTPRRRPGPDGFWERAATQAASRLPPARRRSSAAAGRSSCFPRDGRRPTARSAPFAAGSAPSSAARSRAGSSRSASPMTRSCAAARAPSSRLGLRSRLRPETRGSASSTSSGRDAADRRPIRGARAAGGPEPRPRRGSRQPSRRPARTGARSIPSCSIPRAETRVSKRPSRLRCSAQELPFLAREYASARASSRLPRRERACAPPPEERGKAGEHEEGAEQRHGDDGQRVHREDVGVALSRLDVDSLRRHERQVVEGADARGGRRHGERQVADALEQEVTAERGCRGRTPGPTIAYIATSASHIPAEVAKTRKTRQRPRKAPSPSTKCAAARAARVCQRGGSHLVIRQMNRLGRARCPRAARATRKTPSAVPAESAMPVSRTGAALADQHRSEEDPDARARRRRAAARRRASPRRRTQVRALLPHGLDAEKVASTRREDVVRRRGRRRCVEKSLRLRIV